MSVAGEADRLIAYRLPPGERFTLDARTHERIIVDGEPLMDVRVAFALACEVVELRDEVAEIVGRFGPVRLWAGPPSALTPDVAGLDGGTIRVWKGLDGSVRRVLDGEVVEGLFGGLTVANALRWFAATFSGHPVAPGEGWTVTDRWTLRADRTLLGLALPLHPEVLVAYDHRLVRWLDSTRASLAEVEVWVAFGGGGDSDALGVRVDVTGSGSGEVVVDLAAGKLVSSTKRAAIDITPKTLRRGALALPPMRIERDSEARFRPG